MVQIDEIAKTVGKRNRADCKMAPNASQGASNAVSEKSWMATTAPRQQLVEIALDVARF